MREKGHCVLSLPIEALSGRVAAGYGFRIHAAAVRRCFSDLTSTPLPHSWNGALANLQQPMGRTVDPSTLIVDHRH